MAHQSDANTTRPNAWRLASARALKLGFRPVIQARSGCDLYCLGHHGYNQSQMIYENFLN